MKNIKPLLYTLLIGVAFSCKDVKKETDNAEMTSQEVMEEKEVLTITFPMEPKSDSSVKGEVSFTQKNGEVAMVADLSGLSEGEHAIHIHAKADCSSPDGKSTGGHWNPTSEPHGKWGAAEGYHKGDIGNFSADANGNASVAFSTDEWCIGCKDPNKNILGKAVIVHQGTDDYTSQPSGAAGARISCTGIIK